MCEYNLKHMFPKHKMGTTTEEWLKLPEAKQQKVAASAEVKNRLAAELSSMQTTGQAGGGRGAEAQARSDDGDDEAEYDSNFNEREEYAADERADPAGEEVVMSNHSEESSTPGLQARAAIALGNTQKMQGFPVKMPEEFDKDAQTRAYDALRMKMKGHLTEDQTLQMAQMWVREDQLRWPDWLGIDQKLYQRKDDDKWMFVSSYTTHVPPTKRDVIFPKNPGPMVSSSQLRSFSTHVPPTKRDVIFPKNPGPMVSSSQLRSFSFPIGTRGVLASGSINRSVFTDDASAQEYLHLGEAFHARAPLSGAPRRHAPVYYILEDNERLVQERSYFREAYLQDERRKFTRLVYVTSNVAAPWMRPALKLLEERLRSPAAGVEQVHHHARVAYRSEHTDADMVDTRTLDRGVQRSGKAPVGIPVPTGYGRTSAGYRT
ncbi:hypothetical protein CYMTET_19435 [Cymbomonas tetramitiformis]|uniref:Uncharacterized protein n=1 Tax=Cymbomonas tetramitiformis TaxID=36881 RepID=A0AAE0G603_9CHLO|nr:hypothetical protein CYMTET_19435 [Cymbomonas tetramitiformis]